MPRRKALLRRRGTPEYNAWLSMKQRCFAKSSKYYSYYGGRGITVYPPWITSFPDFLACSGERPSSDHSLDRIDNNGNYEPRNIRWATRTQQQQNKRDNRNLQFSGVTKCLRQWARDTGIDPGTLRARLRKGWSPEQVLTKPVEHPMISYAGRTQSLLAWAKELNTTSCVIWRRLHLGWSTEKALTYPVRPRKSKLDTPSQPVVES